MTGKTLAHYQVLEKLGAGGRGEVYRATDIKLGSDVAIKVLPESFARDPERDRRRPALPDQHHARSRRPPGDHGGDELGREVGGNRSALD